MSECPKCKGKMVVRSIKFNTDYSIVKYVCVSCDYEESVKVSCEEGMRLWRSRK